jgi:hypothetical protein
MDRRTDLVGMTRSLTGDEGSGDCTMGAAVIMKDRIGEAIEFIEYGSPDVMGTASVPTPYSRPSKGEGESRRESYADVRADGLITRHP